MTLRWSVVLMSPLLVCLVMGRASADEGYVMGASGVPDPNDAQVQAAELYLGEAGFTGLAQALYTPEQFTDQSYLDGQEILVSQVEADWDAGVFDADNPLYIFGYSQSATVVGMAEPALADYGIDQDALHFVLVGDPASAYGGLLNEYPDWMELLGFSTVAGAVTPDNYYPTDVYTIAGDNWADAHIGLFGIPAFGSLQHLEYLGLTQDEIDSATLTATDGMTNYYEIDLTGPEQLTALWEAFIASLGVS